MKLLLSLLSSLLFCFYGFSQSVSATFTQGDIPTSVLSYDPFCASGSDIITINLPPGNDILQITDIEIDYSMASVGGDWMSNQRSSIEFSNTGVSESIIYEGVGNNSGTYNYNRPDVYIANGYYLAGETLKFQMKAWRNSSNTAPSCGTEWSYVVNGSWTITVNYVVVPPGGSVGIGTDTPELSSILELNSVQKGFLPPRMENGLMQAIPNPVEGLMVYCTNCNPVGLYTREDGNWESIKTNGNVFSQFGNLIRQHDSDYNDDFVLGRFNIPNTTILSDTFLYFDYSKAAFRAGSLLNSNNWGGDNVGVNSFAFGRNTLASGPESVAMGLNTEATEYGAVAMGRSAKATGESSVAMGSTAEATQYAAAAFGEGQADGYASFAAGTSVAIGENAVALGSSARAEGEFSVAIGQNVVAPSWSETAIGAYNTSYTPNNSIGYNASDRIFSIGIGTSSSNRGNAVTVMKNGNVGIGYVDIPEARLDVRGSMKLRGTNNHLELAAGHSPKGFNAGRIVYNTSANILQIYGAGGTTPTQRIDFIAQGGTHFDGTITMTGDKDFIMEKGTGQTTVEILASEGPNEGSQVTLSNESGHRTIVLDADFGGNKIGRIQTDEIEIRGGADLAEYFDVSEKDGKIQPGMVVCIDELTEGKLMLSHSKYDKKVLGVISGANGIDAGMMMGQAGTMAFGEHAVSLIGRVYVKCNRENGAIQPGDFLTTSSIKGEAMKVKKLSKAQGAILGKALSAMHPENGFVLVFINLQ